MAVLEFIVRASCWQDLELRLLDKPESGFRCRTSSHSEVVEESHARLSVEIRDERPQNPQKNAAASRTAAGRRTKLGAESKRRNNLGRASHCNCENLEVSLTARGRRCGTA